MCPCSMEGRRAVVTLADVLVLRDSGLTGSETWSLLCQATQALQDIFLSSKSPIDSALESGSLV